MDNAASPGFPPRTSSRRRRVAWTILSVVVLWALAAYIVAPWLWERYFKRHPGLAASPRITQTGDKHPGDPINLALLGHDEELVRAMRAIGWDPADPITFDSSVRIAADSVFRKPDDQAPVSNLFLFGRRQDMAFEQPIGDSPRQRHHVRFWKWDRLEEGLPVWFGAVTLDERVGLSHTTGQVTHHISGDIDEERDRLIQELTAAGWVGSNRWIDDFHHERQGRNGGGDEWRTDGRLGVVTLRPPATASAAP